MPGDKNNSTRKDGQLGNQTHASRVAPNSQDLLNYARLTEQHGRGIKKDKSIGQEKNNKIFGMQL